MKVLILTIITFVIAQIYFNRTKKLKTSQLWKDMLISIAAITLSIIIVIVFGNGFVPLIMIVTIICSAYISTRFRTNSIGKTRG